MHYCINIIVFLFLSLQFVGQSYYYGVTGRGGAHDAGTIYRIDLFGNNYETLYDFDIIEGAGPVNAGLTKAPNNKYYGMTKGGGIDSRGIIFSFNPQTNEIIKEFDFSTSIARYPIGKLLLASNNKFYGITSVASDGEGKLFEYDYQTNTITLKYGFPFWNSGVTPSNMIEAKPGVLFGTISEQDNIIFSYNLTTGICTELLKVDTIPTIAAQLFNSFVQVNDSILLNTASWNSGINGLGSIFQFNLNTNKIDLLHSFDSDSVGYYCYGNALKLSDSTICIINSSGGLYNSGTILVYNYKHDIVDRVKSFDGLNGKEPRFSLIKANNNKIYGTTLSGGINNVGVIFEYDVVSNQIHSVYDFTSGPASNFVYPFSTMTEIENGKLFGLTNFGGSRQRGSIFCLDYLNSTFETKINFNEASIAAYPSCTMASDSFGNIYGTSLLGKESGTLFKFNNNTNSINVLHDFKDDTVGWGNMESLKCISDKIYFVNIQGSNSYKGNLGSYNLTNYEVSRETKIEGLYSKRTTPIEVINDSLIIFGAGDFDSTFIFDLIVYNTKTESIFNRKRLIDSITGVSTSRLIRYSDSIYYGMNASNNTSILSTQNGVFFKYNIYTNDFENVFDCNQEQYFKANRSAIILNNDSILFTPFSSDSIFSICTFNLHSKNFVVEKSYRHDSLKIFPFFFEQSNDSIIVGVSSHYAGGAYNRGCIFNFNLNTKSLTVTHSFSNLEGYDYYYSNGLMRYENSLQTKNSEISASVYPNPCEDYFIVNVEQNEGVVLIDMLGRQMAKYNLTKGLNRINMQQFSEGVYFLKGQSNSYKIIKSN